MTVNTITVTLVAALCLKYLDGEMKLVIEDHGRGMYSACQIDIRVIRGPIFGTAKTISQTQCLSMCSKHPLCLAVNFVRGSVEDSNCELLPWLMVEAGRDHVHHAMGWNYIEISK